MKNVTITTTIECNLTADQWQLYTDIDGVDKAASNINAAVEFAFKEFDYPIGSFNYINKIKDKYSKFGASDTEPNAVLDQLMRLKYPDWS